MAIYEGLKWGSAANGAGALVTWAFGEGAIPSLSTSFSGYVQFDGSIASAWRSAVRQAFAAWEAVANIDFQEVSDSASADIRLGNKSIDGVPAPGQSSTLARTAWWGGAGQFQKAEIYFDTDAYITSNYFYYTALHEIGHALGLGHATDPNAVLYYQLAASNTDEGLTADDVQGARTLYGYGGGAALPSLALTTTTLTRPEGDVGPTPFSFTVVRSGTPSTTVSAGYRVTGYGGSPAAASDFFGGAWPTGTISFAAGETSKTITIQVAGDAVGEGDEQFVLTLVDPVGGVLLGGGAIGTIVNDDPASLLSVTPSLASQAEGDAGATPFTFTVARSGDLTNSASVAYSVSGTGTAPASASDFFGGLLPSGTVSFAPGESSKTITVAVAGDTAVEADEQFVVGLLGAVGATIGVSSATATIVNDDLAGVFNLSPTSLARPEGDSGVSLFTFAVTRSGDAAAVASVGWNVNGAGLSQASATDFVGGAWPGGVLNFAPGETSKTLTVRVAGDTTVEADEQFVVGLTNPQGAGVGVGAATGTILNDDEVAPPVGTPAADVLRGRAVDDLITGGAGDDRIDGGGGLDTSVYSGEARDYAWWSAPDGTWQVRDLRPGSPDGTDTLTSVETLQFRDRTIKIAGVSASDAIRYATENILRVDIAPQLATIAPEAQMSIAGAIATLVSQADATTAVATLSYQFFTGSTPSKAGLDYLVSPLGGNANNINSLYYQGFSLENRYINFASNLGKLGEGRAAFEAVYGPQSLEEATRTAYAKIFGAAPSTEKLHQLLDVTFDIAGQTLSRADYFAYYGQDGQNGVGAKAAMVGWLLAEAGKADVGVYAKANNAYLTDLADGAEYSVDLIGAYGSPTYSFAG